MSKVPTILCPYHVASLHIPMLHMYQLGQEKEVAYGMLLLTARPMLPRSVSATHLVCFLAMCLLEISKRGKSQPGSLSSWYGPRDQSIVLWVLSFVSIWHVMTSNLSQMIKLRIFNPHHSNYLLTLKFV